MSATRQRPAPKPGDEQPASRARSVDDFARSVHASYLSRWRRHDPAGLENIAPEEAKGRKRKKRTSAA